MYKWIAGLCVLVCCYFVFLWAPGFARSQEEAFWVPIALQVATTVSEGSLSLDQVAEIAESQEMKALIVTDRDFMRWEYGLRPFENIIKLTRENPSVFQYGIKRYLDLIETVDEKNSGLLVIGAIESAPFYYWKGHPFSQNLKICDWHKHLLVLGLEEPEDYERLPVLSNREALRLPFQWKNLLCLWPFLVLALGFYCTRIRECSYRDIRGCELGRFSKRWRIAGYILIAISLLLIFNAFPFCPLAYDQYCIGIGVTPYQTLIDYVHKKGGMVFWAHPEAEYLDEEDGVGIETFEHVADLWATRGYTGFSIFYEGYEKVGRVGGDWDYLLKAYCRGEVEQPVWAVAGLAFDSGTKEDLAQRMQDLRMYVSVDEIRKEAVLDALREGRVYVSRGTGARRFLLKDFFVTDGLSQRTALMGEKIAVAQGPHVHIRGDFKAPHQGEVEVRLVKDGSLLQTFKVTGPMDIIYKDEGSVDGKTFYRLEIANGNQLIVTNPIFVEKAD